MRILHLADLHLGKVLQEQSLIEDQMYMLKQIINLIQKKQVDAVLIAGDVYDKSIPQTEAIHLLDSFLNTLIKDLKLKVFMIAGNHDSKERLNFASKILEEEGLYIAATYEGTLKKVTLEDEYGPIHIYMLPFVKPMDIKPFFSEEIKTYEEAIAAIIQKEEIDVSKRNLIMTHQFVTAGEMKPERTESESITVGGLDNVDVSIYDAFDYVAIGHVHREQRIGRDTARYAGTMLKYSFSEVNHHKVALILDWQEKKNLKIEQHELIPLRDMREIKGPIEELVRQENYQGTNVDDYIKAIITNEEPVYDAIGRLRKVYPNILKLEVQNSQNRLEDLSGEEDITTLRRKSEIELFKDFYQMQNHAELSDTQTVMMEKIIEEVKNETD